MADTQRTRAQILALFADNVTGQISAQDLRDWVITMMESEFANPGDFWSKPQAKYTSTDKDARGYVMYSQYVGSDVSFMNVLYMDNSTGYWQRADVAVSAKTGFLGLAMDSYLSGVSTAEVLIEGCVYNSGFSTTFSRLIGRPIYLASGAPGSITTTAPTSTLILGFPVPSDNHGGSAIGKWYFKPEWAIKGV